MILWLLLAGIALGVMVERRRELPHFQISEHEWIGLRDPADYHWPRLLPTIFPEWYGARWDVR